MRSPASPGNAPERFWPSPPALVSSLAVLAAVSKAANDDNNDNGNDASPQDFG